MASWLDKDKINEFNRTSPFKRKEKKLSEEEIQKIREEKEKELKRKKAAIEEIKKKANKKLSYGQIIPE